MKNIVTLLLLMAAFILSNHPSYAQSGKYKCMVQMNNYEGEEAYVIISLIDPKGAYEKTLYILGPDKQWFNTLKEWYKFQNRSKEKLSAITGASIAGGDRTVKTIEIEDAKIDKGYKLRFESAVEEQKYHVTDAEIPLTTATMTERANGTGYVRFVKLSKIQ